MPRAALCALLLALAALPASAQDTTAVASGSVITAPDSTASIRPDTTGAVAVASNLPEGLVYLDGRFLGRAEEAPFELPAGMYRLEIAEPRPEAWRPRRGEAEAHVRLGETVEVRLDVPYRYRVESIPYGATVVHRDEHGEQALGLTPLVHESAEPLGGELLISKTGYVPIAEAPGRAASNRTRVMLQPVRMDEGRAGEIAWVGERAPRTWIDYAAAGVAVAAAAVAIYYKFQADELYDEYAQTGDPALRPEFQRYDDISAVALGVSTAAFVTLGVRLVLR